MLVQASPVHSTPRARAAAIGGQQRITVRVGNMIDDRAGFEEQHVAFVMGWDLTERLTPPVRRLLLLTLVQVDHVTGSADLSGHQRT